MSAYRRHMAEYFAQKSENYLDATATHTPTDTATPNEYEPGLEPKGMVTFDEAVHAAEMKQGYNDRDDESIGMRHRGRHQQTMKDRRDESKGMTDSMNPHHPYSDVSTMSAEGSAGDQVVSWENDAGVSSPSGPPSNIMWAEGEDELEKMRKALKATIDALNDCMEDNPYSDRFEDDYDALWENHDIGNLIKGAESAGTSGQGVPVSYGGIPLPADAVAELDAGRDDFGTVMSEMGAEGEDLFDCAACDKTVYEKDDPQDDELCDDCFKTHKQCAVCQDYEPYNEMMSCFVCGQNYCGHCEKYDSCEEMNAESDVSEQDMLKICEFVKSIYGDEPLNGDDIEDVTYALRVFNGDIEEKEAEAKLKPKKSSKPKYRQKGRAKSQGSQNDPCAKSDRACPLDANLWQRSKQRASKEYRVWPSPHASAYAVQLYNQAGGKWSKATSKKHPAAKSKNLNQNSLGNYYGGNYERKGEKGEAVDFSTRRVKTSSKGSAGDPFCGRAYTKDMTPEEFRKTYPRCLPKDGADNLSSRGQRKETLKKRNKLNKRKFTGGGGVVVPVDRKKNKSKKP